MTWADWTILTMLLVNMVATILLIGKPREPITPGHAAFVFVVDGAFIVGLLWSHGAFG